MKERQDSETAGREASVAAGRAAGYCWAENPHGRGLCTWPPDHDGRHRDHYANTEWP